MSTRTGPWSKTEAESTDREPATVFRSPAGEVAVAIVLTSSDLQAIGIDVRDVDAVVPRVTGGSLHIDPVR